MSIVESALNQTKDESELCYTPEERRLIKQELMRDSRRMGKLLATYKVLGQTIPEDELRKFIGIEQLVSIEKARSRLQSKRDHVSTIVSRQITCTPEQLAQISQESSKRACSQAGALASAYWKISS